MADQQGVLAFDGQDDCVNLGKKPAFKIEKNLTIEAWIYASAQKEWAAILSNIFDTGLAESGYGLLLDGKSGIYFAVEPSAQGSEHMLYLSSGANTLKLNQWHHVAGSYDGQQMKVYIDGVEKATKAIASDSINYKNENDLVIGLYKDDDDFYAFNGRIAEVRLWNRARSQAELQQDKNQRLVGNEPGLVGYWPLNEVSGSTVADKTGKGNNGTINGATWQQQELPINPASELLSLLTNNSKIKLKSWKGDYLHRPDSPQGVTTWNTGVGNEWIVEPIGNNKIKLKSWKGDYLHRPDSPQDVTTWNTGVGNEWIVEVVLGKLGPKGSTVKGTTYDIQPKNELARSRIKSVRVNGGWAIDKIQVQYENLATTPTETYLSIAAGGAGGTLGEFFLAPDDYITEVIGSWGAQAPGYPNQEIITLQFKTLKGATSQVFGGGNPNRQVETFSLKAPQNHEIIGFFGEHGNVLYSLGVYVKPAVKASQPQPSGRLWAIQQNGVWTRWAPEFSRWDLYSEPRLQIAADPSTSSACYFINPDGTVHWRDVDRNINKSFPGIVAKDISVGGNGRLWAIQQNGVWTRWAPEFSRWDIYSETRLQIVADPSTPSACYFINPDGTVHWRDVDNNVNKSFPGILAKAISVGGSARLWAIQQNGVWARWAPEFSRWDIFSETRLQIAADPSTPSACYFINPDGTVHWRDVDNNVNKSLPGITAKAISVGNYQA